MKSLTLIKVLLVICTIFTSCKPYNYSQYTPTIDNQSTQKILPLLPVINKRSFTREYFSFPDATIKGLKKIHTDAINKICIVDTTKKYGFYTYKVRRYNTSIRGGLFAHINYYTLFLPSLAGIPVVNIQTETRINFLIFDSKKNLVAKYSIDVNRKKTKAWVGLYFSYSARSAEQVSNSKAHQIALEEFSKLIAKDADSINAKLKQTGTINSKDSEDTVILDVYK